ncbi:MAG: TIGR01458 family HAD-type hydrolase [Candidatus Kryptoniota bacterium]
MDIIKKIKAWLVDLDGTIYVGNSLVPGADLFINTMRQQRRIFRLVSNTSMLSRSQIVAKLNSFGIDIHRDEIITAPSAAAEMLRMFEGVKCFFITSPQLEEEFEGIEHSEKNPDYVVIGDVGNRMDYELLNRAFRFLMNGAELIALGKNRFQRDTDGVRIGSGSFVAALEYASGREAKLVGKPSRQFYNMAVHNIRVAEGKRWLSADFAMVGDEIINDIKGAKDAGLIGVYVKTGNNNLEYDSSTGVIPDITLSSVVDLISMLGEAVSATQI